MLIYMTKENTCPKCGMLLGVGQFSSEDKMYIRCFSDGCSYKRPIKRKKNG